MKKIMTWTALTAFVIFLVVWGVVGLKLLDGDYDITAWVYIALVCWIVMIVCGLYRAFCRKCPHCGKHLLTEGKYCPHCGQIVKEDVK